MTVWGRSPCLTTPFPAWPQPGEGRGRVSVLGDLGDEGAILGALGEVLGHPIPLDLKAQHGLWDQRSKTHPAGGPVVRRVGGGERRSKKQLFNSASFPFQNKAGQPLESCCWPSAPPILKIGGLFLYTPERGGTVTLVLRDQGLLGVPFLSRTIRP